MTSGSWTKVGMRLLMLLVAAAGLSRAQQLDEEPSLRQPTPRTGRPRLLQPQIRPPPTRPEEPGLRQPNQPRPTTQPPPPQPTEPPQPEVITAPTPKFPVDLTCRQDGIMLTFSTEDVYPPTPTALDLGAKLRREGHVYVRGQYLDALCRADLREAPQDAFNTNQSGGPRMSVVFRYSDCAHDVDLDRGTYSIVTVLQPDADLVTWQARALRATCLYVEDTEKVVTLRTPFQVVSPRPRTTTQVPVVTGVGVTPGIVLQTVDRGDRPVRASLIGESLVLRVTVDPPDVYGGFAANCFARDALGRRSYRVTDRDGCRAEDLIFGDWRRDRAGALRANFTVFRFPGDSPYIKFVCDVRICVRRCQPAVCGRQGETQAFGRRRRRQTQDAEGTVVDYIGDVESNLLFVASVPTAGARVLVARSVGGLPPGGVYFRGNGTTTPQNPSHVEVMQPQICVNKATLGKALGGAILAVLSVALAVVLCCRGRRTRRRRRRLATYRRIGEGGGKYRATWDTDVAWTSTWSISPGPAGQVSPQSQGQLSPATQGQLSPQSQGQLSHASQGQLSALSQGQLSPKSQGQLSPATQGQLSPQSQGQLSPATQVQLSPQSQGQLSPRSKGQLSPQPPGQLSQRSERQPPPSRERQLSPQSIEQLSRQSQEQGPPQSQGQISSPYQNSDKQLTSRAQRQLPSPGSRQYPGQERPSPAASLASTGEFAPTLTQEPGRAGTMLTSPALATSRENLIDVDVEIHPSPR